MANQDIKATFGYLILLAAIIGVIMGFMASSYFLAVVFIVGGLLVWMIYVNLAKVEIHSQTGAILIIFGVLLAVAIFMAFGVEQDMWGGYHLKPDGATLSLVILLFAIMPGLIFYYFRTSTRAKRLPPESRAPDIKPPQESPISVGSTVPEASTGETFESPEWSEESSGEDYEYYDPEMFAAYYETEEPDEEDEEGDEEEDEEKE